jgi:hypothetical protein
MDEKASQLWSLFHASMPVNGFRFDPRGTLDPAGDDVVPASLGR